MRTLALLILACGLGSAPPAWGGPISGPVDIIDDTGFVTVEELGNDEAPGLNPNTAKVVVGIGSLGTIFKLFPWAPGGPAAATEIFVEEPIFNLLPGTPIVDYHLELGWWVGGAFLPSAPGDGLDFDWGPPPAGPPGPARTPPAGGTALTGLIDDMSAEDLLDFFAPPAILPGGSALLTYSVDVPGAGPAGATHWVVKQFATIPEPRSVLLLGCALMLLGVLRARIA